MVVSGLCVARAPVYLFLLLGCECFTHVGFYLFLSRKFFFLSQAAAGKEENQEEEAEKEEEEEDEEGTKDVKETEEEEEEEEETEKRDAGREIRKELSSVVVLG